MSNGPERERTRFWGTRLHKKRGLKNGQGKDWAIWSADPTLEIHPGGWLRTYTCTYAPFDPLRWWCEKKNRFFANETIVFFLSFHSNRFFSPRYLGVDAERKNYFIAD